MSVVDRSFDHPMKLEERAVMPLAGGLLQQGYQCGMLWGAALAAGAQAYRLLGPGPQAETAAVFAAQRLLDSFRPHNRSKDINCLEITELEWKSSMKGNTFMPVLKFFLRGGPIGCFRMAARYAPVAFDEINTALSVEPLPAPSGPVSCAALLARKMGASDLHAVMAAGFAGGIGLSGGACGALGAAIWLIVMGEIKEDLQKSFQELYENPKALAAQDRFLKSADYAFECSKIVGRKFENAADHAAYLRAGGCSKIIEALAAQDRGLDASDPVVG